MQAGILTIFGRKWGVVVQLYNKVVLDGIEREKAGTDYFCVGTDKEILQTLLKEINEYAGTDLHYLAELDMYTIPGAGGIISRYIQSFSAESVRGYLLHHLISDKIKDCDKLVLNLYMHFKLSDEYISEPGFPAPAHIYARYDKAIKTLKPKRLKNDLMQLAYHPRDVFYLPFTMKMLASWKIPEIKELFILYSSETNISERDVGITDNGEVYFPPFTFIKRELRFTAIDGLRYYPSTETIETIRKYTTDSDLDISLAAKKTLRMLERSR